MSNDPRVTVLVRVKDEAASVAEVLDLVSAQRVEGDVQVVAVDSGSTDGTVDVLRGRPLDLVQIPASRFTFGYSLNVGCAVARAPVIVALSAHAFPRDPLWLSRLVRWFDDPTVATACGLQTDANGDRLDGPVRQDESMVREAPWWGYTNAAGGFRRDLWQQQPFREDMPGTEDKEWATFWACRGYVNVLDPALMVDHGHWHDPLREMYERGKREWQGVTMYEAIERWSVSTLGREWWSARGTRAERIKARLSPHRAAWLLGTFAGRRYGR